MFSSESFSKDLKLQKLSFKFEQLVDHNLILKHLTSMENVDLSTLKSEEHKKAFWINCYNGMTNYWIIKYNIQENMREVENIFSQPSLKIGGLSFALDDIEHGILRRNARPRFTSTDQRFKLMMQQVDYRIHFALNCGAQSCPPIAFYQSQNIENQLSMAESVFVEQEFVVDDLQQKITCSALFDWYKTDFGDRFLADTRYKNYHIELKEYDWSI